MSPLNKTRLCFPRIISYFCIVFLKYPPSFAFAYPSLFRLCRHENHKIYDMAVKILETYFGVDDEEEAPMLDQPGGGFQFNPNNSAPQGGFQFGGMQ